MNSLVLKDNPIISLMGIKQTQPSLTAVVRQPSGPDENLTRSVIRELMRQFPLSRGQWLAELSLIDRDVRLKNSIAIFNIDLLLTEARRAPVLAEAAPAHQGFSLRG